MFDPKKFCVVCGEETAKSFVKHCCGCIKGFCESCDNASDRRDVMHRKCAAHGGPLSPAEERAANDADVRAYEEMQDGMYDMYDDYMMRAEYDSSLQDQYDSSLQDHIRNGDWDELPYSDQVFPLDSKE